LAYERGRYEPNRKRAGDTLCANSRTPEGIPFHARDSNNAIQLFNLVSYEWGKLMAEKAYLHNLSMPIRFQSVIDAQGG
jgi:hypothetical protein